MQSNRFSTAEIILAVCLVGILVLGVFSILSQMYKDMARVRAYSELTSLTQLVKTNMSNSRLCYYGFQTPGTTVDPGKMNTDKSHSLIFSLDASNVIKPGHDLLSYGLTVHSFQIEEVVSLPSLGPWHVYNGTLKIYAKPFGVDQIFHPRIVSTTYLLVDKESQRVVSCFDHNEYAMISSCTTNGGKYDFLAQSCSMAGNSTRAGVIASNNTTNVGSDWNNLILMGSAGTDSSPAGGYLIKAGNNTLAFLHNGSQMKENFSLKLSNQCVAAGTSKEICIRKDNSQRVFIKTGSATQLHFLKM